MSASLVGSEMCIRDSRSFGADLADPTWSGGAVLHGGSGILRILGLLRGCLLYTSDAADDM
eukprot:12152838-Alexandrium_andersonii.AAC.1